MGFRCAQICHVLLEENAEEASQFATDFLPVILKLSTDMVPNVRIVAAKTLSKFTESGKGKFFLLIFWCLFLTNLGLMVIAD